MSTEKTLQTNCGSIEETEVLARKLARNLRGSEIIELSSDLGGGKTAFTKFLVHELGSQDTVSSPSFTIENIYRTPVFDVHHFDFYRLESAGVIADELSEVIEAAEDVVIIEWSGVVADILPKNRLTIRIIVQADDSREFVFSYPIELNYLVEGL